MSAEWHKRAVRDLLVGERDKFVFEPRARLQLPDASATNLYIHVPFCRGFCPYCPYKRPLYHEALATRYARALHDEI